MARQVYVSLGFESQSDARKPKRVRLQIQDADNLDILSLVILDERQFTGLMSGLTIQAEEAL